VELLIWHPDARSRRRKGRALLCRPRGSDKSGRLLNSPSRIWLATLCLAWLFVSTFAGASGQYLSGQTAARPSGEEKSNGTVVLAAPFGVHTDDLDAMVKRGNIRALVLINPIGFFYSTTTDSRWASCMMRSKRCKPTSIRS
jgi:hypothetical protein